MFLTNFILTCFYFSYFRTEISFDPLKKLKKGQKSSKKLKIVELPIKIPDRAENLNTLGLQFEGNKGAFIRIDSIRMH